MSSRGSNNYDYLFRYIIVGDMGNSFNINIKYKLQLLENHVFFFNLQIINLEINMN